MNNKNPARSLKVTTKPPAPYKAPPQYNRRTEAEKAHDDAYMMREARKIRGY